MFIYIYTSNLEMAMDIAKEYSQEKCALSRQRGSSTAG
jgi:hypothetical protein